MNSEVRSQELVSRTVSLRETPARSSERLIVWQKAHQFVLDACRLTEGFPRKETYELASQLRRAAVSISANIAEGFKKRGRPDKVRFLNIAQGSLEECRYYLILAKDLNYGDTTLLKSQLEEASKLLEAYAARILAAGF